MTTTLTAPGKDLFVEDFERRSAEAAGRRPERLASLQRQAIERFAELGFPHRKMEEWRFINVAPIAGTRFDLAPATNGVAAADLAAWDYPDCALAVVVNGRFAPELSRLDGLPEGVAVVGIAEALERGPAAVAEQLGRHAGFADNAFTALNTALFRDGAAVVVPAGAIVEKPINLLVVGRTQAEPIACFPRNLIVAGESSQVTEVEQYVTLGEGAYLACPVTEVVAGPNAVVDHYKLQRESVEAYHVATLQILQDRDSNFSSHSLSWGGGIVRNDVNALLDGEGCEATLNGLYMVEGSQVVDNHMRVEHAKPHCDSHELYKGILEGRSRAVFSGRIYVHPGAQKTDAKQTNRNLLLSKEALCNSNPQLEIFADDVKCTHGSTVGQLDDNAVFYLRSRGIGEEAARSLLTYAFAADIVERVKVGPVRRELEEFLFRRLPRGEVVRQAV